jgi:predicted dehydrogenase
MTKTAIALVGAGLIAEYHLAGLREVADASPRVVVSRTLAKARALADRFHIAEASDDIAATLRRADIDAVIVTTPDDTHEELAIAALRAGKDLLLQKPMASTVPACRRILAEAAATGRDLQVSWMHRYFPEVAAARRMIGEGAIGKVTTARIRNATPGPDWGSWFFERDKVPGGVVHQLGVHGIDLVGYLFGPITAVSARTATLTPERRLADGRMVTVENPDTAHAVYDVLGGPLVHHEMSSIEAGGTDRFRMEIYGSEGTLWLRSELGPFAMARGGAGWVAPDLPNVPFGYDHHRDWIDGLAGRAPRRRTAADALHGMVVVEKLLDSAAQGGRRLTVAAAGGGS